MMTSNFLKYLTALLLFSSASSLFAEQSTLYRVPDEYENYSTQITGLAGGGVAIASGSGSVRQNPSSMALEKTYELNAGYHWPRNGREFYEAGIVDSKTSNFAAGVHYTGFGSDYGNGINAEEKALDSPIKRRLALGLSQLYQTMAIGISGQYVEAQDLRFAGLTGKAAKLSGVTLGGGMTYVANGFRFAASAENMANKKVRDYAPTTYRFGGAYLLSKDIAISVDYRQRERVVQEEPEVPNPFDHGLALGSSTKSKQNTNQEPEKMVIGAFSAKLQQYFRLIGGYGKTIGGENRATFGGGVAVVSDRYAFSYAMQRTDMRDESSHQAVQLNLAISL